MIASKTIQHNGDRMNDISFVLLSHNEENEETNPKIEIYTKNWARQALLKNFDFSQSQRSTIGQSQQLGMLTWDNDVAVWHHPRAEVARRDTGQVRGIAWWWWSRCMRRMWITNGAWSVCSWGKNFNWRVWGGFWPFLVRFCSGLAVLSLYAFALAVGWVERWNPRVARSVGVTAVTCFWQWLLDEGEGSGGTPKMSTGTKKLEKWLWYNVNNIKYERKTK